VISEQTKAEDRRWKASVILRYGLIQLPGLVLFILILMLIQHWVIIPGWFFWGALFAWIIKDILIYPFVWQAYDRESNGNLAAFIGYRGVAAERLAPNGYIQVHGELWKAEVIGGGPPIEPGDSVFIKEVRGLTLRVEADTKNQQ
jgi:membrane protein implicated in regulation of membrane protease activity